MKVTSISRKLLTRVLSLYFILTFIVTGVQIAAEYVNAKSIINKELVTLEKTFGSSLTRAVWELNTEQAIAIAEGLVAIPMIKGITVTDEGNQIITQLGQAAPSESLSSVPVADGDHSYLNLDNLTRGFFGHSFALIFEFSGRTTKVGNVTVLSSNEVIFDRIEVGIYFLIGNAMVKTAALMLLFSIAFSKLLTNPLTELTEQIEQFDIDDPEASKLHVISYERNELSILQSTYNNLLDQLTRYKQELEDAQKEVISTNNKLDEHNLMLEQEVAKKASSLSRNLLKMEVQQRELMEQKEQLQNENKRRQTTQETLTTTNNELKSSIAELKKAQERLIGAEKMAVLGNLSAEVSHELNTPIGISITSATYLAELLEQLKNDMEQQKLSKKALEDFIKYASQSVNLLEGNLNRASDLNTSYKQIAVDQTSDKIRMVNLAKYLDEIIQSLRPKLAKTNHKIHIECPATIDINCHAGALGQIFTNLVLNSIFHAFEHIDNGEIFITVNQINEKIHIEYSDNGCGVEEDKLPILFDPFYSTKPNNGGTGLGTHIVYNLVTDSLNGTIVAQSPPEQGLHYTIEFESIR